MLILELNLTAIMLFGSNNNRSVSNTTVTTVLDVCIFYMSSAQANLIQIKQYQIIRITDNKYGLFKRGIYLIVCQSNILSSYP